MEAGKDWWCGGGTSQALRVMTDQLMVGTLISFDPTEDIYHVRLQVECGAEREDDAMKAVQGLMAIMTDGRKQRIGARVCTVLCGEIITLSLAIMLWLGVIVLIVRVVWWMIVHARRNFGWSS